MNDVVLICEGPQCNPDLVEIDQAVARAITQTKRWRDQETSASPESVGDARLWDWQRTLAYTVHELVRGLNDTQWATCQVCRHARRYGY